MSDSRGKASWDYPTTKVFIDACVHQVIKGERRGGTFTRDAWKKILDTFNDKTQRGYAYKQLKNRYDCLRKEWRNWEALVAKATSIAFDPNQNKILADDEWWGRKIRENPHFAQFRYTGCRYANELRIIFKDVLASGDHALAPSATPVEEEVNDADDVYRPQMEGQQDPQSKGSADSEDSSFGADPGLSCGVTADLDGMTIGTDSTATGSTGRGKRKIGETSRRRKRSKKSTSQSVIDCMSRMAMASEARTATLNREQRRELDEILPELWRIDAIACDPDFLQRCVNMMMHSVCREMYVGLRGNETLLVNWLREHAYNTPELQKPPKR